MSGSEERLELSDELSRHLLSVGSRSSLSLIKKIPDIKVRARGNSLFLSGNETGIELVRGFVDTLQKRIQVTEILDPFEVTRIFEQITGNDAGDSVSPKRVGKKLSFEEILHTVTGRKVIAKTISQQDYCEAVFKNSVTVVRGPAGTGKTYLASAMAVKALKEKRASKIILSRPVVEAGETLGYLPGDLREKVDPHFRPLYDSLQEFIGLAKFEQFLRQGVIEVIPLAYMRGRTFNEAFVVLDEAQNTTLAQMKMILTRLGYGSKLVITGDHTQIDLPDSRNSSLFKLPEIIGSLDDVKFIELTGADVIRHKLVKNIIKAFDKYEKQVNKQRE